MWDQLFKHYFHNFLEGRSGLVNSFGRSEPVRENPEYAHEFAHRGKNPADAHGDNCTTDESYWLTKRDYELVVNPYHDQEPAQSSLSENVLHPVLFLKRDIY